RRCAVRMRGILVAMAVTGVLVVVASAAAEDVRTLPPPDRSVLGNGVTVLVQENPAAPVVATSVFVKVGAGQESEDNAGISNLLQQVMLKGTMTRSALEIAEAAESLGGSVGA